MISLAFYLQESEIYKSTMVACLLEKGERFASFITDDEPLTRLRSALLIAPSPYLVLLIQMYALRDQELDDVGVPLPGGPRDGRVPKVVH